MLFQKKCSILSNKENSVLSISFYLIKGKGKSKVIPLQAQCRPEGGYRYSSTLP